MNLRTVVLALALAAVAQADPAFDAAMELVRAHKYPEARDALEKIVAAAPANVEAWRQLGAVWRARRDDSGYESAAACLARAVALQPENAALLTDFGITSLELADRKRSLSAATKGREALEKALRLEPDRLDAREALYDYFSQAPFFAGGSASKAAAQLEEIRKRDPDRALATEVMAKVRTRDFDAAFAICERALAQQPDNYAALFQEGRVASITGRQLSRGLECLNKVLTLKEPGPGKPTHSNAWFRIGDIQQKLGHVDEARHAYETALALDPRNQAAAGALQNLR